MVRSHTSVVAVGATALLIAALGGSALAQSPSAPAPIVPGSPAASPAALGSPGAPASASVPITVGPIIWKIVDKGKDFTTNPGVYSVGQLPDGRLLVVGSTGDAMTQPTGAAWVSADGSNWKRLKGFKAPKGSVVTDIDSAGATVVASGIARDGTGLVWTSADGSAWSAATPMNASIDSLARTPTGLVGVGVDGAAATAWSTTEGLTWVPVTLVPSGRAIHVVAGADGTLVASGQVFGADDALTPVTWTSVDSGLAWTQTVLEGLLPGQWSNPSAAATPAGFVVTFSEPGQTGSIGHVWSSPDGITWTGTYVDQKGFLSAAGSAGSDALLIGHGQVLRSPGGVTWTPAKTKTFDNWTVRDVMTLADGRLFAAGDTFDSAMATWIGTAEPAR